MGQPIPISGAAVDVAIQAELDAAIAALSTVYQPLDTDLSALAALTSAADKMPYATGAGTWALATLTPAARTVLDDADTATMRNTLGFDFFGGKLANAGIPSPWTVDGNTDIAYELTWAFHSQNPGGPLWLRFNGDTGNNYGVSSVDVVDGGAGHYAMLLSATNIGQARHVGRAIINTHVDGGTRRHVDIRSSTFTDAGVASTLATGASWTNTATNITSITVSCQFSAVTGIVMMRRLVP